MLQRLAIATLALTACASQQGATTSRQDELFDPEVVQEIRLDIAPADLATLDASASSPPGTDFPYVPATFHWKDITLQNVGVRFKGNSSRAPVAQWKHSYLIKFDELVDKQKLFGLKRLGLDNAIQFGSLFSERMLNEILTAEGVPAIRANYTRLYINDVYEGVYVTLERIDKKFLSRQFADNDGNLYKCDVGGAGANLAYLGSDPSLYSTAFEADSNVDTADFSDIVALANTLQTGTDAAVEAAVDLDDFTKTMAIMMLGGAFDQYTGFNAHNYYLYRDPTSSKWIYLAHDLDVGFADHAFANVNGNPDGMPIIDGWNAATPQPVSPLPLVDRVLAAPTLAQRYRDHVRDYLDRYFEPGKLGARLDALYAQIADDLATDPYPNYRVVVPNVVGYPAIIADMKAFMQRRYDTAKWQLGDAQ